MFTMGPRDVKCFHDGLPPLARRPFPLPLCSAIVAVAWAAEPESLLHFPMFYDAHATPADTLLSIYSADTTKFSCAFGGIR